MVVGVVIIWSIDRLMDSFTGSWQRSQWCCMHRFVCSVWKNRQSRWSLMDQKLDRSWVENASLFLLAATGIDSGRHQQLNIGIFGDQHSKIWSRMRWEIYKTRRALQNVIIDFLCIVWSRVAMKLRPNGHALGTIDTCHATQKPPNSPKKTTRSYRVFFWNFCANTMTEESDSDFEPQDLFDHDLTTPTLRRRRLTNVLYCT